MTETKKLKIAVVGAGVAGIVAAYLLDRDHDVSLFEKASKLGGHTNTVVLPAGPDAGTPVDTGFIVLNDRTYPLLHRLLNRLGVPVRQSDMSFGFACDRTGLQWAGTGLDGLFAQRGNLLRLSHLRMIADMVRFNRRAARDLEEDKVEEALSLGEYLERRRLGREVREHYIVPMGAAIWSTNSAKIEEFPARTFLEFFRNHGLLTLTGHPQWQTVIGGSHAYVKKFESVFGGTICVQAKIRAITRSESGAELHFQDASTQSFDRVVVATHADEALRLLDDPSELESRLLGPWSYNRNDTVLHWDRQHLPENRRAWASWNYRRERTENSESPLSVTYDMNRLQGLKTRRRYLVTLNSRKPIPRQKTVARFLYTHPLYTFDALRTQRRLPELNGVRNTYFCGSYFGYGFHEDAVRSGVQVGRAFGVEL